VPNIALLVHVTRDQLGLPELDINDHLNYIVAGGEGNFLGSPVTYVRNRASSPFLDGSVGISETRDIVQEKITLEVFGADPAHVFANILAARQAFTQRNYTLKVGRNTTPGAGTHPYWWLQYACEKADYQLGWGGPRLIANQMQAIFTVPRQPAPLAGAM